MGISLVPVFLLLVASSTNALDAAQLMHELTWGKRVLLVFALAERDASFQRQDVILESISGGLTERDMIVIRVFKDNRVVINEQSHWQSSASFHRRFEVDSNEFRVILVGKDGTVKLDRKSPVNGNDLFTLIDSMPMRRYEMLQNE